MAQTKSVSSKTEQCQPHPEWNSSCLGCGAFIARSSVPFSGKVPCEECGAIDYFEDSPKPVRILSVN